jgi:hypothetical protein
MSTEPKRRTLHRPVAHCVGSAALLSARAHTIHFVIKIDTLWAKNEFPNSFLALRYSYVRYRTDCVQPWAYNDFCSEMMFFRARVIIKLTIRKHS